MDYWQFIQNVILLLTGAVLAGGILSKLGQSPIVGYILAGVFFGGPWVGGLGRGSAEMTLLAEIGLSLLMFSIGLDFSWEQLRRLGLRTWVAGISQIVLTIALVMPFAYAALGSFSLAFILGAAFSMSSTACVLRIMEHNRETDSAYGRQTIAMCLVQDMSFVPLALAIEMMLRGNGGMSVLPELLHTFIMGLVFLGIVYILFSRVLVRALEILSRQETRELSILTAVITLLSLSWGAHRVELPISLGAFLGGMLLGSTDFAAQIRSDLSSFRAVFLTLFFGVAGMAADPVWIAQNLNLVLVVTLGVLLLKAGLVLAVLLLLGYSLGVSLAVGLAISQVGEFAFVLTDIASSSDQGFPHLGSPHLAMVNGLTRSVALCSLCLTPFLLKLSSWCLRWGAARGWRGIGKEEEGAELFEPEFILVGYGPAGKIVGSGLKGRASKVLVIDLNPSLVAEAKAFGFHAVCGDAASSDLLDHYELSKVCSVIVTIPGGLASLMVLRTLRIMLPQARLLVRSRNQRDIPSLKESGAHAIVGDEEEAGNRLLQFLTGN